MSSSLTSKAGGDDAAQAEFRANVRETFSCLQSRGIGPNESAALAMLVASRVVEAPVNLVAFIGILSDLERGSIALLPIAEDMSRRLFSSAETLTMSIVGASLQEGTHRILSAHPDLKSAPQQDFQIMFELYCQLVDASHKGVLFRALEGMATLLARFGQGKEKTLHAMPNGVAISLTALLDSPLLTESTHSNWIPTLGDIASSLPDDAQHGLVKEWRKLSTKQLTRILETLQQYITLHLYEAQAIDQKVEAATKLLELLNKANGRSHAVPFTMFYNDAVNSEDFNIVEDYRRWKNSSAMFSFCKYSFIYDTASKSRILQLENDKEMYTEFQDAVLRSWLFSSSSCPYLILRVRRSPYLVHDTLRQIEGAYSSSYLKKPLKVQFIGEEGVDEGGVAKEFFQLLLRDLFDSGYGMFTYNDSTRLHWFRPSPLDQEQEFRLVGIMIGLAIYNSQLLELAFPQVLYRKLVGEPVGLEDMQEIYPDIYNSLHQLLKFEGDVESCFGLNFQIEYEAGFGEMREVNLGRYDSETPVTSANREEFVQLYTENVLNERTATQYEAFAMGFYTMCSGPARSMFRAEELEALICGSTSLDFEELERHAIYADGYTGDSVVIQNFWAILHRLDEKEKKMFLQFVTGSDRVPIKGLGNLRPPFVISRNGPHSHRLPTAHTCFNHLLLPDYEDHDTLERHLRTAINNSQGFGLI